MVLDPCWTSHRLRGSRVVGVQQAGGCECTDRPRWARRFDLTHTSTGAFAISPMMTCSQNMPAVFRGLFAARRSEGRKSNFTRRTSGHAPVPSAMPTCAVSALGQSPGLALGRQGRDLAHILNTV